jgi:hypothetical protein
LLTLWKASLSFKTRQHAGGRAKKVPEGSDRFSDRVFLPLIAACDSDIQEWLLHVRSGEHRSIFFISRLRA